MLRHLSIQNFALIENVELAFSDGFTVITGETGSGKSILLGALRLLLGDRADLSLLKNTEQKTIVEGVWEIGKYDLEPFFTENELDFENQCIVRRELLPNNKSRAFINDTPVNLNVLKALSEQLIQINSQHFILSLKDKLFQLAVLDNIGESAQLLADYKKKYLHYLFAQKQYNTAYEKWQSQQDSLDYKQFQLQELNSLSLEKENYDLLRKELETAEKAGEILQVIGNATSFFENEQAGLSEIKRIVQHLAKLATVSDKLADWETRLQSQLLELKEINAEMVQFVDAIDYHPTKIQQLLEKVDQYNRIANKHKVNNQQELLGIFINLREELSNNENDAAHLGVLKTNFEKAQEDAFRQAEILSESRKHSKKKVIDLLLPLLFELKMPDAQLDFEISKKNNLDATGIDAVELLFSSNKGHQPVSIGKTASGGELARFMLSIQVLLSAKKQLPTVVFDEIDTGVSGEVAEKIGRMLRKMGGEMQLLAISHLPQVAAAAQQHLKVSKNNTGSNTSIFVTQLNESNRVEEIAKLMSGEKINHAALENAQILIQQQK
jgi:DNA repair protein RecN (Recombination protein N)